MTDNCFWRDSSGRLTFDMSCVSAADFPAVCKAVAVAFSLIPDAPLVIGLDQIFWDYRQGEHVVGFDWDNWMGFMVVAKTTDSESLVRDIGVWLHKFMGMWG